VDTSGSVEDEHRAIVEADEKATDLGTVLDDFELLYGFGRRQDAFGQKDGFQRNIALVGGSGTE
jgi:hypothetical protein